jgi:radical SAM/Cys-rich protein
MPVAAERAAARPPDAQRELLRRLPLAGEFDAALAGAGLFPLRPSSIKVLQVNVGKLCNQTCRHCHVDAGPDRREIMSRTTLSQCVRAVGEAGIPIVDITGGAPELNPHFRWFVSECRKLGAHVIDRCNLTVLTTQKHQDLPEFFATHQVEVVASLPHYLKLSTDRQRGDGVHERSIEALLALNGVGYAREGSGLRLVLVTNPVGAFLPGNQASLEKEWKRELLRLYGVRFDALFTITNMPISRYLEWLLESGNLESYLQTLVSRFNAQAARAVMCRSMISVGWDGYLYDCDFNQMLELPVAATAPRHIADFDAGLLLERDIVVDRHCFGCTAGAGSSCGGATAAGEERPA